MFSHAIIQREGISVITIRNTENNLYAEVIPEWGGFINQLSFGETEILKGYKNKNDFTNRSSRDYHNSILFPYPNRLHKGEYKFNGKSYAFPELFNKETSSIHGLVYNKIFLLEEIKTESQGVNVTLCYKSSGESGFPFPFSLSVCYFFTPTGLGITFTIENTGSEAFPFGLGWHPYFYQTENIDKAFLQLPKSNLVKTDNLNIPSGELIPYNNFSESSQIKFTSLDNCFEITEKDKTNAIVLSNKDYTLNLILPSANFNYYQLFTPQHRNAIAIEPMTCAPNAFNNNLGLQALQPNKSITMQFEVGIKLKNI